MSLGQNSNVSLSSNGCHLRIKTSSQKWAMGNKHKIPECHGGDFEKKRQREICTNLAEAHAENL